MKLRVLEVLLCLIQHSQVNIVAPDFVVEVRGSDFPVLFLLDAFPFAEIEFFPSAESEVVAAVVLGGNVHGKHGGFD